MTKNNPSELLAELGESFRYFRKRAGMNQSAVAGASNANAVSRFENGDRNVTVATLCEYADAVGLDLIIDFAPKKVE